MVGLLEMGKSRQFYSSIQVEVWCWARIEVLWRCGDESSLFGYLAFIRHRMDKEATDLGDVEMIRS